MTLKPLAVVAGAGGAFGPALLSGLGKAGYQVAAIARNPAPSNTAIWYKADLSVPEEATECYRQTLEQLGAPSVLIYNAHRFLIKPFEETSVQEFEDVWRTDTLGAFVAAQSLLPAMVAHGGGTVIFSGATAAIRGSANFAAFASAKFALRGLSQSLAREYGKIGVHVAHVIIDGIIDGGHAQAKFEVPQENCISPVALSDAYLSLIKQQKSAWTHELDLRPFNGTF